MSRFWCPAGLLLFLSKVVPTQNCNADTSWVQPTKNVEKFTLLVAATASVPATIVSRTATAEGDTLSHGVEQMLEGYLTAFGIKASFLFCPCFLLVVVWRKREILSLLNLSCSLDFFSLLFSLSALLYPPHGQEKGVYLPSRLCPLNQSPTEPAILREGLVCHLVLFVPR